MAQNDLSRFIDNGDGTITDTQSNLLWQKQDDGHKRTFEEAKAYCNDLFLGKHEDWRLPTIEELRSISSYWKKVFTDTKDDEPYWSSNVHKNPYPKATESQKYAAEVMFSSGETNQYFVIYQYYVRAVCNYSHIENNIPDNKKCPNCGEIIEEQLDECQQCSVEQPNEMEDVSTARQKKKLFSTAKISAIVEIAFAFVIMFLTRGYFNLFSQGYISIVALLCIIVPLLLVTWGSIQTILADKKTGHIIGLIGFLFIAIFNLLIPSDFPLYIQPKILVFLSATFIAIETIFIITISSENDLSKKIKEK